MKTIPPALFVFLLFIVISNPVNAQLFSEDFENSGLIPEGWIQEPANQYDWEFLDSISHYGGDIYNDHTSGSGYFAYFNSYNASEGDTGKITSPVIDLSSTYQPVLKFYYNRPHTGYTSRIILNVYANGSWHNDLLPDIGNSRSYGWKEITYNLNDYKYNDVRLQFEVVSDWNINLGLDDILIFDDPADYTTIIREPITGQIPGSVVSPVDYSGGENLLNVFNVEIVDNNASDAFPTYLTKVAFVPLTGTYSHPNRYVSNAFLSKDGIILESANTVINYNEIYFEFDDTLLPVTGTSNLALHILLTSYPNDNYEFGFMVDFTTSAWETSDQGSHFNTDSSYYIEGNDFLIDISASRLMIATQPPELIRINDTIAPVNVMAVDDLGNVDQDFFDTLFVWNNEGISMTGTTAEMNYGSATFSEIAFQQNGVDIELEIYSEVLDASVTSTPVTIFSHVLFKDDFESDNSWYLTGDFILGTPQDTTRSYSADTAYSGINALCINLYGEYQNNVNLMDEIALSPVCNTFGYKRIGVAFKSWSGFEGNNYDYGTIDVMFPSDSTTISVENRFSKVQSEWETEGFVVPDEVLDGDIQILFSYRSDYVYTYDGWNIDDFEIVGVPYFQSHIIASHFGILTDNSILEIPERTTVRQLLIGLTLPEGSSVKVLNSPGGTEVTHQESTFVTEDMVVVTSHGLGNTTEYAITILDLVDVELTDETVPYVYPNPANDELNISGLPVQNNVNIQIVDITGKKVLESNYPPSTSVDIDVSFLEDGIYMLYMNDLTTCYHRKILISH